MFCSPTFPTVPVGSGTSNAEHFIGLDMYPVSLLAEISIPRHLRLPPPNGKPRPGFADINLDSSKWLFVPMHELNVMDIDTLFSIHVEFTLSASNGGSVFNTC